MSAPPAEVRHAFHDPKPGDKAARPALPIHGNPRYADGYDVIVHNACAADEDSAAVLDAVLAPHWRGTPGVNLHCAMHSYRSGDWKLPVKAGDANARWFEYTRSVNVAWTHRYGPLRTKVFSMTLAHNEAGMADPRYLDLLARGLLWSTGRLREDGQVEAGYALPK